MPKKQSNTKRNPSEAIRLRKLKRSKLVKERLDNCDLKKLYESDLTDKTILENKLHTESDALVIPYFDLKGDDSNYHLSRPHNPRIINGKKIKYIQPKGVPPKAYFPKCCRENLAKSKKSVFITEGPLKALAISQTGLDVIGLTGVWCAHKKDSQELIDDLQAIDWNERKVYIVFDYDEKVSTREHVYKAKCKLAESLKYAGATEILSVDLPPGQNGRKQGADDYLVTHDKQSFLALVNQASVVVLNYSYSTPSSELFNLINIRPPELGADAYFGIAGKFLRKASPYTEATDAGVLSHLLPAIATYIGPKPFIWAGGEQPARINFALVGHTSTGRKGTSFVAVNKLMENTYPEFWQEQYITGLSTGEGLIKKVADEREKNEDGEWEIIPVEKRLFVLEPEFSRVLSQSRRDGNILSQVIRQAFDSGKLQVLTRNDPLSAIGAHICVIGHITPQELKARLTETEMANGFGNRFLWFYVKSTKEIPLSKPFPEKLIEEFVNPLKINVRKARKLEQIEMDKYAVELWEEIYPDLRQDRPGIAGALTARGECIVLRTSLIYALMNGCKKIQREHLQAGLAVWEYSEKSVQLIFGSNTGTALADQMLQLLSSGPMKTSDFHKHTNKSAKEISAALNELKLAGRVRCREVKHAGAGRPTNMWQRLS